MSSIYILIIILSGSTGWTTVQEEFSSRYACEAARTDIVQQASATPTTQVRSSGCYKK